MFYDTYSQAMGRSVPGVVTGKPAVMGGTAARRSATGVGVYVDGFPDVLRVDRRQILETECDILIPAALDQQIDADNADP